MRTSKMSVKMIAAMTLVVSILMSVCLCAFAAQAADKDELSSSGAVAYYLYGLNTNDPDFGSMSGPNGTFIYDSAKQYYYCDVTNFQAGDYCFVVSSVNGSGASAQRSPSVSSVAQAGSYYLSQGNYHGYNCMHLWNPNHDSVRIYFTSESSGLYAVALKDVDITPTSSPVTPTSPPTPSAKGYVYCQNEAGWGSLKAYMWSGESNNGAWPGQLMTKVSGNIWRYEVSGSYANIIFNDGSNQTDDLTFPGVDYIYNNKTNQWSKYSGGSVTPTSSPVTPTSSPVTPTTSPVTPPTPSGKNMVYCENEAGWGSVYVYMWSGSGTSSNGAWPGKPMSKLSGSTWSYEVTGSWENIIFNNGSDANKTSDLSYPGAGYIFNNASNSWEIYDTSPLQVISYKTDVESPQYNGVAINLSAEASGEGTVYYKFTVSSSSGAKQVIADFSTKNTALWTPAAAGNYTITYDFKDTKGNTNSRTASYRIDDGAASVAPYIKTVSPAEGQIKKSRACTVSISAGGGITGTKLLFYKYTVTDPSGKTFNTPYYTRNSTYSFTPSALGYYTVTVTVQGSDNQEATRSYVFQSVDKIDSDTPIETMPPATTPPTAFTMKGDADMDSHLSVLDATRIQKWLASLVTEDQINLANSDTDGDGYVTILDATRIQKKLANLIDEL